MRKLRIAFMGTPGFAAVALKSLIESDHDVVAVYSQPPRPKGRGHKMQKSAVHELADQHHIPVHTPVSFKKEPDAVEAFKGLDLDVAIVAAYGLLLPKVILDAPKYGCLNIHGSILPRWRGAAPIQRAILAGDSETGITIMQMDEGLDTGPMIYKETTPITVETTASTLHDSLADIGARLTLKAIEELASNGSVPQEPQDNALTTYADRLSRDDGRIDWTNPADYIERQLRSLTPWPGVWCQDENQKRVKIHSAEISAIGNASGTTGQILDRDGHIICGDNTALKLTKVQPENAKAMDVASAINGGYLSVGSLLK